MNIIRFIEHKIRQFTFVEYRLAVYYEGSPTPENTYSVDLNLLRRKAESKLNEICYWTIYKRGPLRLEERPIEYGIYHEKE